MDDLLEQFLVEGRDLVAQASADFAVLARDPHNVAAIENAFRAIHTLKGSFGIFALTPAEQVLHAAEDMLERARAGKTALEARDLSGLIACLDQVDRWIDEMEQTGTLGDDADTAADSLGSRLLAHPIQAVIGEGLEAGPTAAEPGDWVAALARREAAIVAEAEAPLTAFRYAPDADCFFRGDDPLLAVAAVPELMALDVLPSNGAWPDREDLEPFICFSVIEGLSAALPDAVRSAFRMMPDQVEITTIAVSAAAGDVVPTDRDGRSGRALRVDAARLTDLADGLADLLVAIHGLTGLAEQAEAFDRVLTSRIRTAQADLERIGGNLQRSLSAVRSVPLESALRRLPRMAREIAHSAGKEIDLEITGEAIEADRQIADGLFEPLLHLLRNAIDHGIEPADKRVLSDKPIRGQIALALRRDGGMIEAVLTDDGAGIDPDRIRRVAIERGLVDAVEADALSDAAALLLIFEPGFSTARTVTELSGRGFGMDAVQTAVAALRGTVEVDSRVGTGTQFRIRIPANALTTRLLVVEADGHRYGVSLDQVLETVRVADEQLLPVGCGLACVMRGRTVPVLSLAQLLGGQDRRGGHAKLIVTRSRGERVALRVDGMGERIDTFVRAPSGLLASIPGIMGSALLSDGGVLLVLDLPELAA